MSDLVWIINLEFEFFMESGRIPDFILELIDEYFEWYMERCK